MQYVIGVDCGGTKTKACAYSPSGELLATSLAGSGNVVVNEQATRQHIEEVIKEILEKYGNSPQYIALGIGGVETAEKITEMKQYIKEKFPDIPNIDVMNDGTLAFYANLKGEDGISVISGTGSIIFGKNKEEWIRIGGFGHILGDEGSATWIGTQAFKMICEEIDSGRTSDFTKRLLEKCHLSNPLEAVFHFYTLSKSEIAQIAVFLAQFQDEKTEQLFKKAGCELAKQVNRCYERMQTSMAMRVSITGSVVEKNQTVQRAFLAHLNFPYQFISKREDATKAAYYLFEKK